VVFECKYSDNSLTMEFLLRKREKERERGERERERDCTFPRIDR